MLDLLVNNPALSQADWLPKGLWPELDDLRDEHVELVQRRDEAAAEARALRSQYEAEDAARVQAYQEQSKAPKATPQPKREGALTEARAQAEGASRALSEFLEAAVETIQSHLSEWLDDLTSQGAQADAKREEAQRLLAEADQQVRELGAVRRWIQRTAKNQTGRHITFAQFPVPLPEQAPDLATVLGRGNVEMEEVA